MRYLSYILFIALIGCQSNDPYIDEIHDWRTSRVESLTAPTGWASLSGLYWIENDSLTIGGNKADITFSESLDEPIATITQKPGGFFLTALIEGLTENDRPFQSGKILTDRDSIISKFNYKQWQWMFIERGDKVGLRLWDTTHINRSKYSELDYYPIDETFRLDAVFKAYDSPLERTLRNVLGMDVPQVIPGELRFEIGGETYSLQVLNGTDEEFFIIFADETTGGETYGGGRYLYSPKPKPGTNTCVIDFNKAYTPPCGFTEFATCLLPSSENTLKVEITAGEVYHFDH